MFGIGITALAFERDGAPCDAAAAMLEGFTVPPEHAETVIKSLAIQADIMRRLLKGESVASMTPK